MARLRYNGLTATLGAPLTNSGTTITFAAALTSAAGAVPTIAGGDIIPLSILDGAGKVSEIVSLTAYTSGATTGTITRAQEGTAGIAHAAGDAVVHSPTIADFASASSGSVLAFTQATTSATYTTSSTTDADVDATNLTITFTVPSTGKVKVELSAAADCTAAAADWTLRTGTTTVQACTIGNAYSRKTAQFYVSGLTPGASVTYKWGHRRVGGTGAANIYTGGAGGVSGNAIMTVTSMP